MAFDPPLGSGKPNCSQPMSECGAPAPIAWQTPTAALHCKPSRVGDFTATSIFSMRCSVQKSSANVPSSLLDAPELPVSFRAHGGRSAVIAHSSQADVNISAYSGSHGWKADCPVSDVPMGSQSFSARRRAITWPIPSDRRELRKSPWVHAVAILGSHRRRDRCSTYAHCAISMCHLHLNERALLFVSINGTTVRAARRHVRDAGG